MIRFNADGGYEGQLVKTYEIPEDMDFTTDCWALCDDDLNLAKLKPTGWQLHNLADDTWCWVDPLEFINDWEDCNNA